MEPHHLSVGARRNSKGAHSWLSERREILENIKDQVRLYLGDESHELRLYARAYKKDLMRPWQASSLSDLHTCLLQVDVVFGGDFHPFSQAQRAHLRLMRKVIEDRPVVLALECLFVEHQKHIDQYMTGKLSESEFLKRVKWSQNWGFPWDHYKPLLEFARRMGIPVFGLNVQCEGEGENLKERDQFAARTLFAIKESFPNSLIYCLYGDLHIAQSHLPKSLRDLARKSSKPLDSASVYLNSEHIYFQLAEDKLETKVEVVAFSDRHFCVLSSPPWVKWQSYLMYLEENFDVDLDSEDEDEDGDWEFRIDHTDHVSNLVALISSSLELEIKRDELEVYSLQDPQAYRKIQKILSSDDASLARQLVKLDKGFYLPSKGFFYLSKATVNHAATLAGQFVHAKLCQRHGVCWDFPSQFLQSIWLEAMSFLLSKFVNPKRKAQTMADLKKQLQAFDKEDQGREPLLLALDQKMAELLSVYAGRNKSQVYQPREKSSYVLASQFLGEMLGERYFLLFHNQIIGITDLVELLQKTMEVSDFHEFYYQQLKNIDVLEMAGESFQ